MKKLSFLPRFIPNLDVVLKWGLASYPIDLSACPSREVNHNVKFEVHLSNSYTTVVPMGVPFIDADKPSVVILDKSYFTWNNLDYTKEYPKVKVQLGSDDVVEAIAKPSHLRILSNYNYGIKTLKVDTQLYGTVSFDNILCTQTPMVQENTLLIPDYLWEFFRFSKDIWMAER